VELALTLLFDSDQANDEQMTRESTGTSTATHTDASLRFDWTKPEVQAIYRTPLPDLLFARKPSTASFIRRIASRRANSSP